MKTDPNDRAFPPSDFVTTQENNGRSFNNQGLSKREYFAARVLPVIAARSNPSTEVDNDLRGFIERKRRFDAAEAVLWADALIAGLNSTRAHPVPVYADDTETSDE